MYYVCVCVSSTVCVYIEIKINKTYIEHTIGDNKAAGDGHEMEGLTEFQGICFTLWQQLPSNKHQDASGHGRLGVKRGNSVLASLERQCG